MDSGGSGEPLRRRLASGSGCRPEKDLVPCLASILRGVLEGRVYWEKKLVLGRVVLDVPAWGPVVLRAVNLWCMF
jgi:hypothetical protein